MRGGVLPLDFGNGREHYPFLIARVYKATVCENKCSWKRALSRVPFSALWVCPTDPFSQISCDEQLEEAQGSSDREVRTPLVIRAADVTTTPHKPAATTAS